MRKVTVTKQYNNMTTIFGEQAAAQSLEMISKSRIQSVHLEF